MRIALVAALLMLVGVVPGYCLDEAGLVAQAKKEGVLRLHTSELDYTRILIEAFSRRYPFVKIDRTTYRAAQSFSYDAYENEDPAKRADVFLACQIPGTIPYQDVLAPLNDLPAWKERPKHLENEPRSAYFLYFLGTAHGILYNSALVSDAEVPRTYEELVGPKWTGKVAARSPLAGNTGAFLAEYMLANRGDLDWYARLGKNRALLVDDAYRLFGILKRGERPVAMSRDIDVLHALQNPLYKGLKFRLLDGELPYQFQTARLNKLAPDPGASRLFLNWLISGEARAALESAGYSVGETERRLLSGGRKVWMLDVDAVEKSHQSHLHKAVRRLKAGGAVADAPAAQSAQPDHSPGK